MWKELALGSVKHSETLFADYIAIYRRDNGRRDLLYDCDWIMMGGLLCLVT